MIFGVVPLFRTFCIFLSLGAASVEVGIGLFWRNRTTFANGLEVGIACFPSKRVESPKRRSACLGRHKDLEDALKYRFTSPFLVSSR